MADSKQLISTLKQLLKANRLTYADVARQLQLSEVTVKRMFSTGNVSLPRLDAVCAMIKLDLHDLVIATEEARARTRRLSRAQETELVSDPRLLLVAVCARLHWSFDDIIRHYSIDRHECTRLLARLDRLGLIEYLPGDRIKPTVAHDFEWLPGGPIETFFSRHVQQEFLDARFDAPGELRLYVTAMLSAASIDSLNQKLRTIVADIAGWQRADAALPSAERQETSLLVAMRDWELSIFSAMRRNNTELAPKSQRNSPPQ